MSTSGELNFKNLADVLLARFRDRVLILDTDRAEISSK